MRTRNFFGAKFKHAGLQLLRGLREQSGFKAGFVAIFAVFLEFGLTVLFLDGFRLFRSMGEAGGIIIGHLFSFFFFGMGILLAVSGLIACYATLYRSEEVHFLCLRPIPTGTMVLYKFFHAALIASWAFYFIMLPFTIAYALFKGTTLLFPFWMLLFSVPFLILCSGIAAIGIMIGVRWFPFGRLVRGGGAIVAICVVFGGWWFLETRAEISEGVHFSLSTLVPGFRLAESPLLPSYWLTEGVTALARGGWFRGLMFFNLLLTSALMVCLCVVELGNRIFLPGWGRISSGGGGRRTRSRSFLWAEVLSRILPNDIRAVLMKDIRTFFRDPVQWSQVLIFFGLLGFYFVNLRTFSYHTLPEIWRMLIALLNIFSVSAVTCSLAARFIYPQLSLEGQAYWLLGLSPVSPRRLIFAKFIFALLGMVSISAILIFVSAQMLELSGYIKWVAVMLAACVAIGVCSLSTGLGAIFMDLTKKNPSAIVSGFGGTLNLVCCLGVMTAGILPFAIIFYSEAAGQLEPEAFRNLLLWTTVWLGILTAGTTYIPLWLGNRSLARREF